MTVPFYLSYGVLWVVVVFHTLVLLGLVRGYARRIDVPTLTHPLPFDDELTGHHVPEFSARNILGEPIDQSSVIGERTALLFVSPNCATCSATLDEVEALERRSAGRVVLVCRGIESDCRSLAEAYGVDAPVVVDPDGAISRQFGVNGTPTAIIVSENGQIETYGHPVRGGELEGLFISKAVHA